MRTITLNMLAVLACYGLAATYAGATEPLMVSASNRIHFASVADEGRIRFRSASDNKIRHTFYICHPQAISFSEDGRLLAAAGGGIGSHTRIKVWCIADHTELCDIVTGGEGFNALAVSSNGNLVAGLSSDGHIAVWRVSDGQSQWSRALMRPAKSIEFSPDSKAVHVLAENRTERQFDAGNGRRVTATVAEK